MEESEPMPLAGGAPLSVVLVESPKGPLMILVGTLANPIRTAPTSAPRISRPLSVLRAETASSRRSKLMNWLKGRRISSCEVKVGGGRVAHSAGLVSEDSRRFDGAKGREDGEKMIRGGSAS